MAWPMRHSSAAADTRSISQGPWLGRARICARLSIPSHYAPGADADWRLAAVLFQRIAQSLLERAEPRLIVLPLIQSFAEDRLPDLLGTGGADVALGAVELHAPGFELQSAKGQDAAHA